MKNIGEYGVTFQLLRRAYGLHQRELDGAGVTTKTVSRFENQRYDLALSNVLGLLNEVPLTLHEYLITSTRTFPDSFDGFMHFIGTVSTTNNAGSIIEDLALRYRILYAATGAKVWRLRAAMLVPSGDVALHVDERRDVRDYLHSVRDWTSYEFILLRRTILTNVLSLKEIPSLWSQLRRFNSEEHRLNYTQQRRQLQALLLIAQRYMDQEDFFWVERVLAVARQLPVRAGDINHLFTLRMLEAELLLRAPRHNRQMGSEILHGLISSADFLMAPQLVARLQQLDYDYGQNGRTLPQKA